MGNTVTLTHKGWFGICPVYFGRLETEAPDVHPRHWSLSWLMDLSESVYGFSTFMLSMISPDFEPQFPLLITGELKKAKVVHD